jgi:hypothetical protein
MAATPLDAESSAAFGLDAAREYATGEVAGTDDEGAHVNAKLVVVIYKLLFAVAVLAVAVLAHAGLELYLYHRSPDLVYIREDAEGRTVAVLNNREMGTSGNVTVSKDRVTDQDKIMAASKFAAAIYGVSPVPEVRARDIAQAITQMVPQNAQKLSTYLEPILAEQKRDNWSTVWNEQSIYLDKNDRMLVHIIGSQTVDSSPAGGPQHYVKQFDLAVKLYYDKPMETSQKGNPRAARNLNTGFLVLEYTGEEIQKNGPDGK